MTKQDEAAWIPGWRQGRYVCGEQPSSGFRGVAKVDADLSLLCWQGRCAANAQDFCVY